MLAHRPLPVAPALAPAVSHSLYQNSGILARASTACLTRRSPLSRDKSKKPETNYKLLGVQPNYERQGSSPTTNARPEAQLLTPGLKPNY